MVWVQNTQYGTTFQQKDIENKQQQNTSSMSDGDDSYKAKQSREDGDSV